MHLVLFNVRLKTFYNPGMITGLFGIGTVVIIYLATAFDPSAYAWHDYLLGFVYQIRVRILPSSTGGEMNHTPFSSIKQSTGSTRMTFDQPVGGCRDTFGV